MKAIILDGTPEEIRAALPGYLDAASTIVLPNAVPSPTKAATKTATNEDEDDFDVSYIEKQTARRYLNRRILHDTQRTILTTLAKASPEMVTAPELQEKLGISTSQFAGMMGAMGRRLTNTPGWVEGDCLFIQEWDTEKGYYCYGLPDSVIEAMKAEKLI
ncbi:hypothetical protein [Aureimonas phyllosphaerae]|uniref:Uncharacterized protein n=1 Tax=Aureimonas phyllosphaerae TaxID=1166078 RepID=A0A7W6C440_9HYPH|nr:hypothetical protein [Aureimonas phyllosphaerae]MBB3938097.1 hypothetical protein [Aureimonas phyllosphaerae]MBB3962104.1 hypothetical protein [Aureimonas phyllosphaerae]SFF55965.1 hypothetical protein SAMN05216566_12823 [Aureimonas phyllosphaerae]